MTKKQKYFQIKVTVSEKQKNQIEKKAQELGLTKSAYLRFLASKETEGMGSFADQNTKSKSQPTVLVVNNPSEKATEKQSRSRTKNMKKVSKNNVATTVSVADIWHYL